MLRYLWAFPTTLLGLLFVPVAWLTGGRVQVVRGVVEVYGGLVAWLLRRAVPLADGALAMTLGHVVLGQHADGLARCRPHEHVHVRQAERWGPLFVPAYLIAGALAWLRGGHLLRQPLRARGLRSRRVSPSPDFSALQQFLTDVGAAPAR